jgi:MFS family permease
MTSRATPRFFFGWVIVAVCLVGISSGPAAFGLASMGLFSEAFSREFGWSRTEISLAVSAMMLCTAFSMPVAGRLVDRLGARKVLIPSIIILALCLAGLALVRHYWQFLALYVAMGTVAVGTNSVAYMRIIACWFERSRGLAIGIAGSGTGLGFAYVPLLTEALVSAYGWRAGYAGLCAILLCITLPLVLFLLKEQPRELGLVADGGAMASAAGEPREHSGLSLTEALGQRDFWLLALIFGSLAFVLYGLIPHLVPMLTDRGLASEQAAATAAIFGLAAFAGRLLIGFLVDRFDARRIALIFFTMSAGGLALLAIPMPSWAFIVAAVLLGGSLGAEVDMLAYLTSRYFGLRWFAQIFSVLFSAVMIAMGIGPIVFGAVYDWTGSYTAILTLGVPVCGVAVALVLLLKPYDERQRGGPVSVT